MFDHTRKLATLARAARAIFTTVGHGHALPNTRIQNGFLGGSLKGALRGLYRDFERHIYDQGFSKPRIVPVQTSFLGAPSRRFKQTRVLIVGCADVGLRVRAVLPDHVKVLATTSNVARVPALRSAHCTPVQIQLDDAPSLRRLAGLAHYVLHLAPPPSTSSTDTRTRALLAALRMRQTPKAFTYASTTGVYGHCDGQLVDETRTLNPQTPRALRRVDAEHAVRVFGRQSNVRAHCLRIPGIYAADRPHADPLERIRQAVPVLTPKDDVYTNHIHANDLARTLVAALWRGRPVRNYNVAQDCDLKMGDYYDWLADQAGLPRPPRISKAQALATLSPMRLSFLNESRRINNERMKRELRIHPRHAVLLDSTPQGDHSAS